MLNLFSAPNHIFLPVFKPQQVIPLTAHSKEPLVKHWPRHKEKHRISELLAAGLNLWSQDWNQDW